MDKTGKISWGQLAALLVLSRVFSEATSFPLSSPQFGMQRFTVILASKVILLLLYIPVLLFMKKHPGENVISALTGRSKALGWTAGVLFILMLLLVEVITLCKLEFYASSTIFSEAAPVVMVVLVVLVVIYAALKGIQPVARVGVIAATAFVLFILGVGAATAKYVDLTFLYPSVIDSGNTFWKDLLSEISRNAELIMLPLLLDKVRDKPGRAVYWYIPAILLIIEGMFFLEATILGPYLSQVNFPFYLLAALSDITIFQRLDGIDVAIWIIACIIKGALITICIKEIFVKLTNRKASNWAAVASVVLVGAVGLYFVNHREALQSVNQFVITSVPLIIGVITPVIAIFAAKGREKSKNE